jgi:hypothetical protein
MGLFENAAAWQARKDRGESQVGIARSENLSESNISRTLRCGRLPNTERQRYQQMLLNGEIVESAVMDLAECEDAVKRQNGLIRAKELCDIRDREFSRQIPRRGARTQRGKITAREVRQAFEEAPSPAHRS